MEAVFTLTGLNPEAFLFLSPYAPSSFTLNRLMDHKNQCCEYNFLLHLLEFNIIYRNGSLGTDVKGDSTKCP